MTFILKSMINVEGWDLNQLLLFIGYPYYHFRQFNCHSLNILLMQVILLFRSDYDKIKTIFCFPILILVN